MTRNTLQLFFNLGFQRKLVSESGAVFSATFLGKLVFERTGVEDFGGRASPL